MDEKDQVAIVRRIRNKAKEQKLLAITSLGRWYFAGWDELMSPKEGMDPHEAEAWLDERDEP